MTEEFTIGIIIALSIGQLVAWIGYWHWRSEAKYLRMMWQNEHEMNTALFSQVRELERPKVYQADSAKIAQLSEEEREAVLMAHMSDEEREEERAFIKGAIEEVDCGKKTIHPFLVEEPLPPGTVLHQEGEKCQNGMN